MRTKSPLLVSDMPYFSCLLPTLLIICRSAASHMGSSCICIDHGCHPNWVSLLPLATGLSSMTTTKLVFVFVCVKLVFVASKSQWLLHRTSWCHMYFWRSISAETRSVSPAVIEEVRHAGMPFKLMMLVLQSCSPSAGTHGSRNCPQRSPEPVPRHMTSH